MADINIDVYYTGFLFARDERIPSRGRHLSRRCDITKKVRYRGAIATSFVESVYWRRRFRVSRPPSVGERVSEPFCGFDNRLAQVCQCDVTYWTKKWPFIFISSIQMSSIMHINYIFTQANNISEDGQQAAARVARFS